MENEPYTPEILKMLTFEGYLEYFQSILKEHPTDKECYEETERVYTYYFSKPKFTSYESFKSYKCRYLKQKCKQCLPIN